MWQILKYIYYEESLAGTKRKAVKIVFGSVKEIIDIIIYRTDYILV